MFISSYVTMLMRHPAVHRSADDARTLSAHDCVAAAGAMPAAGATGSHRHIYIYSHDHMLIILCIVVRGPARASPSVAAPMMLGCGGAHPSAAPAPHRRGAGRR